MARQLRDAQCHTIWEGTENICCLDVRRAIQRDAAHEVLFARVERALDGASTAKPLAFAVDTVALALDDARAAVDHLESAPTDVQLLHARRSRSCWPTPSRPRCCSTKPRGHSSSTTTRARPWWPAGSPASGSPCCRRAASSTPTAPRSTTSTPSSATAPSTRPPREGAPPRSGGSRRRWSSRSTSSSARPSTATSTARRPGSPTTARAASTLEWRLHPVAGYRPPDGLSHYDLWEQVVGALVGGRRPRRRCRWAPSARPLTSLWDGLECFAVVRRRPRARAAGRGGDRRARARARRRRPRRPRAHRRARGSSARGGVVDRRDAVRRAHRPGPSTMSAVNRPTDG